MFPVSFRMSKLNWESRSWRLQKFSRRWRSTTLRSTAICSWTWWVVIIYNQCINFRGSFFVAIIFFSLSLIVFPLPEQGCILHWLHKGAVQAGTSRLSSYSKERRSWCWREEGQWRKASHILLPAKGCIQAFAHKFTYFCPWGHRSFVEKVYSGGQSWQVCTVRAQRASWSRCGFLSLHFELGPHNALLINFN